MVLARELEQKEECTARRPGVGMDPGLKVSHVSPSFSSTLLLAFISYPYSAGGKLPGDSQGAGRVTPSVPFSNPRNKSTPLSAQGRL